MCIKPSKYRFFVSLFWMLFPKPPNAVSDHFFHILVMRLAQTRFSEKMSTFSMFKNGDSFAYSL